MPNDHRDRRYQEREARRAERARRRAARREARNLHPEEPRKERVLHTRITEQLADDIRRVADELRVPVSNLVRNALEEAFSVVETVSENVGELLEEVFDEAERARDRYQAHRLRRRAFGDDDAAEVEPEAEPPTASRSRADFPEVLGWQSILLNRLGPCADCARALERGDEAFVGVGAPGTPPILCPACAQARRR